TLRDAATPALAVALCAEGDGANLRTVLGTLRRQTIADRLEVLSAALDVEAVSIQSEDRDAFADVRVVSLNGRRSLSHARAVCIRAARAEFVAFGEDHCLPNAEWAEVLLARLTEGYTGVGPRMINANPGSVAS